MNTFRDLKNRVIKLCRIPFFRKIIFPAVKVLGKKTYVERLLKLEAEERYFLQTNNNRVVLRGPFKGMKYASFNSYGGELAPKIIGSYEMELNEVIENVIKDSTITEIIDVGSAEGYYAIGFAIRKPDAQIFAYDIKKEAIDLCKAMAKENKIGQNIQYGDFCSDKTLQNFNFRNRAFIISDCEGYEFKLFNKENLENLKKCDLLIELHDFINPEISTYLKSLFFQTHHLSVIKSETRNSQEFPELSGYSIQEQKLILSECRFGILDEKPMEWLFAKSKLSI